MNWESRPNSHNRNLKHHRAAIDRSHRFQCQESRRHRAIITTIKLLIRSTQSTPQTRIASQMSPTIEQETMELCWQAIHRSHCEFGLELLLCLKQTSLNFIINEMEMKSI